MTTITQSDFDALVGRRGGEVGFIILRVTAGEVDDHDVNVRHLDTDIRAFDGPEGSVLDPAVAKWRAFRNGVWTSYSVSWSGWHNSHQSELERTGDGVRAEFEALKAEYNELRRQFLTEFDGASSAPTAPKQNTEDGQSASSPSSVVATATKLGLLAIGAYVAVNLFAAHRAARG